MNTINLLLGKELRLGTDMQKVKTVVTTVMVGES